MEKLPGYAKACELRDKYLSERAKHLGGLEKYVDGTQYAELDDFFSERKPLWERAPCIVYPIVKSAINSNGDLLLGEGRFPDIKVDGTADEDDDEGNSQAEDFERTISKIIQQARLKSASREVFAAGQGCGSACAIFGVRAGRLFIDTVLARWCEPALDIEGAVGMLEIRYPYLVTEKVQGTNTVVCKLFRRVIDAQNDITFLPANAQDDGTDPKWTPDPQRTVKHGLGFCPVVWYPHLKGCQAVNDFDGQALHEHLTDEIRAHDFALSQRHRAALYAGDPQWTEIGVEPGYNPTGRGGRKADVPASVFGRPGDVVSSTYTSELPGRGKARKKSPGVIWQYGGDAQKIKVELHTLPGEALKALDDHAHDLRNKLAESLGVVFLDPEGLPNESRISGLALKAFKARQLDRIDYYRCDFGDHFLTPALGMLMRIALVTKLQIDGLDLVRSIVTKAEATKQWSWNSPPIHLVWGDYYKPAGDEEQLIIQGMTQALGAGIATKRAAVERLRTIFGIKDVDAYMLSLQKEQDDNDQRALDQAKNMAALAPKPAPGAPPGKPAPKKAES